MVGFTNLLVRNFYFKVLIFKISVQFFKFMILHLQEVKASHLTTLYQNHTFLGFIKTKFSFLNTFTLCLHSLVHFNQIIQIAVQIPITSFVSEIPTTFILLLQIGKHSNF